MANNPSEVPEQNSFAEPEHGQGVRIGTECVIAPSLNRISATYAKSNHRFLDQIQFAAAAKSAVLAKIHSLSPSSPAIIGYTMPANAAPTIGATQNSHNCCSAHPPTKSAGPVLRAGLTERFVTGMPIR